MVIHFNRTEKENILILKNLIFMFHRRNKLIRVWTDVKVSEFFVIFFFFCYSNCKLILQVC